MSALIFDTETTGLPDYNAPINHPNQPYIVQLAALLIDDKGDDVASMNFIIKPDNWSVPNNAAEIHGIPTERAEQYGVPISYALNMFMMLFQKADYLVAHNIEFDIQMLRRYSKDISKDVFHNGTAKLFDTMYSMTDICKIPLTEKQIYAKKWNSNIGDYKNPNLSECYWHIFTEELSGAHNAMIDVEACKEVFLWLKENEGKV